MRVIAGTARSLPLKTIEGLDTRPTTDRIKETLFNMLTGYIPDAKFLDLFAGSGGIGIEALSRGADSCTFVELNPKAIACIEDNVAFTHFKDNSNILKADAISYVSGLKYVDYDVIFMDPPYGKDLERQVLSAIKDKEFTEDTLIVVEAALDEDFSYVNTLGYEITKDKRYKSNKHIFLKKREL
ncbi:MAG: 16S rRNA (guanine(966)-N(2))-methyltransferase RsmD [Lachnospiraceae bacterium]|nr:16S rRNA (guanine(966)-N(2))-methyltransferase RsmD [Lachnospiraceae bacterium]